MTYPKIETLYKRDPETHKVLTDQLRCPEFGLISNWLYTEKIDGMNVRVCLYPDGNIAYFGRTNNAQLHPNLTAYLERTFTVDKMRAAFEQNERGWWPIVTVYGEGYGPKIQSGGKYRDDVAVRLFDVKIDEWWLNWADVADVAQKLGVLTVPVLRYTDWQPTCLGELDDLFLGGSIVASGDKGILDVSPEGIVARTDPLLFDWRGRRVMWKLKRKDF